MQRNDIKSDPQNIELFLVEMNFIYLVINVLTHGKYRNVNN